MNIQVIPVKTHIITPKDDLVEVIRQYAGSLLGPKDVVVLAESPVAINQGRFLRPEWVKLGLLAKALARFIDQNGSLSSPFAMQVILNEHGKIRVTTAFLIGALGRIVGKRGLFYRFAGEQAALVDDVTGTMPPYDKYIVLGPKDPEAVVQRIKKALKVEAAIIDACDLGAVRVVAATSGVPLALLQQVFAANPAGNADEQTPLVVLKRISNR